MTRWIQNVMQCTYFQLYDIRTYGKSAQNRSAWQTHSIYSAFPQGWCIQKWQSPPERSSLPGFQSMKWRGSLVGLYYIQPWFVSSICCVSHADLLFSPADFLTSKTFVVNQLHWLVLTPLWSIGPLTESFRRLSVAQTCLGKFRMALQMLSSLNLRAQLRASCQAGLLSGTVAAKHWTARTCRGWCGQLHITPRVYRSTCRTSTPDETGKSLRTESLDQWPILISALTGVCLILI